jgi:hypothetical protein
VVRANNLSGLSDCLFITGKSGSDDGIAERDEREKQRMHESEENEDIRGGVFIPYLWRRRFHAEKDAGA